MKYNFSDLSSALENQNEAEIKCIIKDFDQATILDFLQTASANVREIFIKDHLQNYTEIIPELEEDLIVEITENISEEKFAGMIRNFPADEITNVLESLEQKKIDDILKFLPYKTRIVLQEILSYPEESAGRLIDKDFIVIPKNWDVDQALQLIKSHKKIPKDLNEIFIIDDNHKPVGSIKLVDLLRFKRNTQIQNVMQTNIKIVEAGKKQEDVIHLFQDYSLVSMPVVSEDGKITGVISLDNVVDVISEEAEEDILHVGKVSESDIRLTVFETILSRIKWLAITFISINISSYIIGFFAKTLEANVELAILMPIVAAMGGNAGIQASTISLRAIVSKQLISDNATRLFRKELIVGFLNGLIMSALLVTVIFLRFHSFRLELTFLCVVTLVFTLATSIGSAIPLIVEKLGGDSALSSSIITSSFTDILSFTVLFAVATFILI